jgi:hypothetical protein
VTGIRNGRYLRAHPFRAVQLKTGKDVGRYLQPELYGQPRAKAIGVPGSPAGRVPSGAERG